jgi:RHS repeat-associated protein
MFPALVGSPVGLGWTHEYAQTLRPEDGTSNRLYHITAEGYEREYLRIAPDNFWVAINPAELRGTIVKVGTDPTAEYQLTDLNGTITGFDVTAGTWKYTKDRWGNTISGIYTSGQLTTISDSEGRQIQLANTSGQVTITLPNSKTWKLTLTGGLMTAIRDPLHPSSDWRTYSYVNDHVGVQRLLSSIKDDGLKELEAHTYETGTDRGATSSQAGGTRSNVTVAYNDGGGTRTVTHTIDTSPSVLQTTVFTVSYLGGRWMPSQISGNCATCGGANADLEIFTYDYANHVTDRKDGSAGPEQVETQYTYDGNGMLLSKIEVGQRTTNYAYAYVPPGGSNMAPWPAFLTQVTEQSAGNPGSSKTTSYTWNSSLPAETTLTTAVTGYLNPSASVTYTTTSTFGSPRHRLTAVTGPVTNQKVAYSYIADAATNDGGRRQTASVYTSATAHLDTTLSGYDLYGTPGTVTDPNSVLTVTATDDRGRVSTVVSKKPTNDANEPPDYTTSYLYDSRDRLTSVTFPLANKLSYGYEDGTNRLIDTIRLDSAGNQKERLHLTLNTIGGKRQEDYQLCTASNCSTFTVQKTESFQYDTHNRLLEIDHPVPSGSKILYTYDSRANLKTVQDENHLSANTTYGYDSLNRLTSVTQTLAGAPAVSGLCPASAGTIVSCYGYDIQDNLKSVTDPNGNVTTYAYDDFRRMQSQVSPVSGTPNFVYDAAGNLTSSTDANSAVTTRTYDAANRLLSASSVRSGFNTETVTYTYGDPDPAQLTKYSWGRLASMTEQVGSTQSGSTTYAYERRGLLRKEAKTIAPNTYTLSYGYDPNGNRSSITYPSGRVVTYAFDFADRPLSAASGATSYVSGAVYQPFGPESSLTYGTSPTTMTRTMAFDQRYRPTELKLQGTSTIYDYFYNEDPVGNILSICASSGTPCSTSGNPYNRVFTYDDLNRLSSANSGSSLWVTGSYAYDSMGNMTSATLGSTTRTFTYLQNGLTPSKNLPKLASVNEIPSPGNRGVSYDPVGNETMVGSGSFTYSSRNYLALGDGLGYTYDGRGLRVSAVRTGVTLFPVSLTVDPQSVKGGGTATGTVTLNDTTGGTVTLASSDASVTFPGGSNVMVPSNQASQTFIINTTTPASDRKVVVSATMTGTPNGVTVTAVLTVTVNPQLVLLSLSPRTVQGALGRTSTGTVTLNGGAPSPSGALVTLSSANTQVATVPGSVTVQQNLQTASFTVTTTTNPLTASTSVDISATYSGVTQHTSLVVVPYAVQGKAPQEPRLAGAKSPLLLASLSPARSLGLGSGSMFRWSDLNSPGFRLNLGLDGEAEALDTDSEDPIEQRMPIVLAASFPGSPKRDFIYSPETNLLAESELSRPREKAILYEYIWFNGHPVAQVDAGTVTHWTFTDHLGTPLIQTTATQTVWWRAEYEPYGRVFAYNPAGLADQHQPLRFPGQEAEQLNLGQNGSTERSYNIFRWYRPSWGRYTQPDPLGLEGGQNLFGYANANPVSYIDSVGLTCTTNWNFFWSWWYELGPERRWYFPSSVEQSEIAQSAGASFMRDQFRAGGCKDIAHGSYGTMRAYFETFYKPCDTSFQVGGFIFSAKGMGNCQVQYRIYNQASLYSFFLHFPGVPHKPRSDRSFPFGGNIDQYFQWTEKSPCSCCN